LNNARRCRGFPFNPCSPLLIAELYTSLQGEGLLTGKPSVFVRASGCNLRCWFCDTPFTSWQPEGRDWPVDEIVEEVDHLRARRQLPIAQSRELGPPRNVGRDACLTAGAGPAIDHAVITGGEPMLFAEMLPLCEALRARGMHITIETAGTLYLPVACDLMSISPKLASSTPTSEAAGTWSARHERSRHQPDVMRRLLAEYDYQLKFVIDRPSDLAEVEAWLAEFPQVDRRRVLLMPQGTETAALERIAHWLVGYCREQGFGYCPRKHIKWYGGQRGT
jgi:7-carboxy-7-deazaguanine synthase